MGGGGVQRLIKFLKYFDYEKYSVTVLTVKFSFFYSSDESLQSEIPADVRVIRSGSLDPFRLLHFYQLLKNKLRLSRFFKAKEMNHDGPFDSEIHSESTSLIRRISMSFFIPDSRILWLPFALFKLWQFNRINPIHLAIASMPPFTSGLIGTLFSQWRKVPVILDFRDAWTNNPYLPKVGRFYSFLNAKLEKYCMKKATGAIFVNPNLRRYYEEKYSAFSSKRLITIRNGFDTEDFDPISETDKINPRRPFIIGIMGTIYSQGNRPTTLLRALDEILQEDSDLKSKIQLIILGKWSSDFLKLLGQFQIAKNIELISYMPHRQALKKAAGFDALSLSIESGFPGNELVTPGRIYEYFRLRKPVLATCPLNSDLAFLIKKHHAGEVIEFDHVDEIKSILKNWICNRSSLPKKYRFDNLDTFNRRNLTYSLLEFLGNFDYKS